MTPVARMVRLVAAGVAVATTAAACAPGRPDPFEISVRIETLDLVLEDEGKAPPPEPQRVIEVAGLPEEILDLPADPPRRSARPPGGVVVPARCPEAPPNTFPKEPVTLVMRGAPKEGIYTQHNRGTVRITTSTGIAITLPYPPVSTLEIRKVVVTPEVPPDPNIPEDVRDSLGRGSIVTFEATRRVGPTTIVDQYRYDDTKFELLQREKLVQGKRLLFAPTPPVTLQELGRGNGDDWVSAGVDRRTDVAMVVNGTILNNEAVDLCGKKYDSLPVVSSEQLVNLTTNETMSTDPQQPNVYRFANHYGGLVIQEEGHYTETLTVDNAPVTLEYDYTSTFDAIDPIAP